MNIEIIPPKQKAPYNKEQLNAAQMAKFIRVPSTDAANHFVSDLEWRTIEYEKQSETRDRKRRAIDAAGFKRAIGAFAADLLIHMSNSDAMGFMYRPASREALADTLVSSRSFEQLVKFWLAIGLIEATGAIHVRQSFEGDQLDVVDFARARRFRATDGLIRLAAKYSITPQNIKDHFEEDLSLVLEVIVRSEKQKVGGKKVPSRNIRMTGERYEQEAQRVRDINNHLRTAGFDLLDTPRVYRLFNRGAEKGFDFNMGGRLYCGSQHNWQKMSSQERGQITCRGEQTVEIDVRSSHLFILSALLGKPLVADVDPYSILGIEREVVKGLIVATTGKGELPSRWPKELNDKYKSQKGYALNEVYQLKEVIGKLRAKHPIIDHIKRGQMDWARLQYEESECFVRAMLELGQCYEVGALPVHDSLIVAERHSELARDILGQTYQRRFGVRPNIIAK